LQAVQDDEMSCDMPHNLSGRLKQWHFALPRLARCSRLAGLVHSLLTCWGFLCLNQLGKGGGNDAGMPLLCSSVHCLGSLEVRVQGNRSREKIERGGGCAVSLLCLP